MMVHIKRPAKLSIIIPTPIATRLTITSMMVSIFLRIKKGGGPWNFTNGNR